MGWFSWFSSKPDTSGAAPDRSQRKACWDARDAYYACLDKNFVLKPGTEEKNVCSKEKKQYEGSCAKSWIEYFNTRRVLQEEQKDQLALAQAQADEAARKKK
ncbi:hypothetical protein M422DRAFT_159008 [Sphaerobolus stellatus SS14]|nr:hypothetical protein M422DRAFT_159008 [Sphaerobolus stellatus SS14]